MREDITLLKDDGITALRVHSIRVSLLVVTMTRFYNGLQYNITPTLKNNGKTSKLNK